MTKTTQERVDLAFAQACMFEPFIGAVLTKVKREVSDYGGRVTTAATDGFTIWFNPDFVEKQTEKQLFGLLLHEAYHIVLMHTWRRGDRDPQLYNIACDALINRDILERRYHLPDGGVSIPWVKSSMSSEEVYAKLKQDKDENGDQGAGGFDGEGDMFDAPADASSADMEAAIIVSAQMAKAAGKGSPLIERVLGTLGNAKVDWRSELRAMMTSASRSDYTYRKFSRRFIAGGMYLPSLHSEDVGGLLVGIDTSGSMTQQDLENVAAEINSIAYDVEPEFIEVVYCDTQINKVQRFERGDEVVLKMCGGGGTRFKPVFDHISDMEQRPAGVVYFTDMEGNLDELVEPEMPVIWCNTGNRSYKQPFGVLANAKF